MAPGIRNVDDKQVFFLRIFHDLMNLYSWVGR